MSDAWTWTLLAAAVLVMLVFDLVFFGRKSREITFRAALFWSVMWSAIGVGFVGVVWWLRGGDAAEEYLAGFVIEKSLSIDNLFVFALIFGYFAVPLWLQRRVIFWGIVGAILLRGVFIFAGAALLDAFHWMVYVFGGFLVLTAIRMARHSDVEIHPERNPVLRGLRRIVPMTTGYYGDRFVVRVDGARMITPLVAAFILVATFDVVFAVDSIPAIFAVTEDTFVVYAANAMSLLGLTALYFLLAGMMQRFRYLSLGLAVVLAFVGTKMLLSDVYKIPIPISLAVIVAVLTVAIVWSLRSSPDEPGDRREVIRPRPGTP
jgi:tellurite resistance protein TerC